MPSFKRFFLRWLGVPDNEPREFYRDAVIGLPTGLAAVVLVAFAMDHQWSSWPFGAAFLIVLAGIVLARDKQLVLGIAVGFVLVRLVFTLTILTWQRV